MLNKVFVCLCGFLAITSVCFSGGMPEDKFLQPLKNKIPSIENRVPEIKSPSFSGPADWVYKASDWVLNLYITQKGTRSQGSHGVLIFEGKEVQGVKGETKALPIGTVEFHGPAHARVNLWDDSGWQMKDPLVKPFVHTPKETRPKPSQRSDIKKLE